MDSAQRKHFFNQLAGIINNPEQASLARQFFMEQQSTPNPAVENKPSWKRQIGGHWIVALIAGVGVSYQGTHDIEVRLVVLFLLFVWLAWDSWIILAEHPRKVILGAGLTALLTVIFVSYVCFTYFNSHQVQKDAEAIGLEINNVLPSDPAKPIPMKFVIQNRGPVDIPRTRPTCMLNDLQYGGGGRIWNTLLVTFPGSYDSPLGRGGDGESYTCQAGSHALLIVNGTDQPVCADVSVNIAYALPFEKTGTPELKTMRFATREENGHFQWYQLNRTYPWGYCTGVKITPPPS